MEVIYDNPDEGNPESNDPHNGSQKKENRKTEKRRHQESHQHSSSKEAMRGVSPSSSPRRLPSQTSSIVRPHNASRQASCDSEGRTSQEHRRTQSCSSPPLSKASSSGSPRRTARGSSRQLNAPSSVVSVTSSCSSSKTVKSHHSSSHRKFDTRRLSPAALEAARMAVAARAAYAKHRPSRAIEKASFFIVTSEGERRIDCHEMEELLARSPKPRRSSRHRNGSRQSVNHDGTAGRPNSRNSTVARTNSISNDHDHHCTHGRRSPITTASVSSGSYNNSPKRAPRKKRFSASVSSADAVSVRSGHSRGGGGGCGTGEHFQRVRFHSFSRGSSSIDLSKSLKSLKSPEDPTSLASLTERREKLQRERFGKFSHDASAKKPSVVKFAIAGVVMLIGTCGFLLSYVFGKGETWSIAGSSVMGVGSLLFVLGVCWYLSSTTVEGAEGSGRLEIRVVDQSQLAKLSKKGACVQTVTVKTC